MLFLLLIGLAFVAMPQRSARAATIISAGDIESLILRLPRR